MKMIMKMLTLIALLVMSASCATTTAPVTLPDKYNLDDELTSVRRLSVARVSNWVVVDNQSVIVTANGGEYYLFVLSRPIESAVTNETIGITDKGSSVTAGYDKIYVRFSSGNQYYIIEKIYKLDGRDQAKEIKDQLS